MTEPAAEPQLKLEPEKKVSAQLLPEVAMSIRAAAQKWDAESGYWIWRLTYKGKEQEYTKENFGAALHTDEAELIVESAIGAFQALRKRCRINLHCENQGFVAALHAAMDTEPMATPRANEPFFAAIADRWNQLVSLARNHVVRAPEEPPRRLFNLSHFPDQVIHDAWDAANRLDPQACWCPLCEDPHKW